MLRRLWWTLLALMTGAVMSALPVHAAEKLRIETHACGDEIVASFRLANDLICAGNGLEIRSAGITVDLNGHEIMHASGCCAGIGVNAPYGYNRVQIRNGIIVGFTSGVELVNGDENKISGLTLTLNATGIRVTSAASSNRITNNRITDSTYGGITLLKTSSGAPTDTRITANELTGNGRGIELIGTVGDLVSGNEIQTSDGLGVQIADTEETVFRDNIVRQGGDAGVQVLRSNRARVNDNAISQNAKGINVDNSDDSVFRKNRVMYNAGFGIVFVNGSSNDLVKDNLVSKNDGTALAILASSSSNEIVGNNASNNGGSGIVVDSPTHDNRIVENRANGNRNHGIETYSLVKIARNVVKRNGYDAVGTGDGYGLGISALDGTLGSRNTAADNDDPDQCYPSTLCS